MNPQSLEKNPADDRAAEAEQERSVYAKRKGSRTVKNRETFPYNWIDTQAKYLTELQRPGAEPIRTGQTGSGQIQKKAGKIEINCCLPSA